jgi:hypothetical protein
VSVGQTVGVNGESMSMLWKPFRVACSTTRRGTLMHGEDGLSSGVPKSSFERSSFIAQRVDEGAVQTHTYDRGLDTLRGLQTL